MLGAMVRIAPPQDYEARFFVDSYKRFISPTHKRTEGRAPVSGSEFTSKRRRTTGGGTAETAARLNVKLWLLTDCAVVVVFFYPMLKNKKNMLNKETSPNDTTCG